MIVKKRWLQTARGTSKEWTMEGWYLFGLLPIYTRDLTPRCRRA